MKPGGPSPFDPVNITLASGKCVRCGGIRSASQKNFPLCGFCYAFVWGKDKTHCAVCKSSVQGKNLLCNACRAKWEDFEKKDKLMKRPIAYADKLMSSSGAGNAHIETPLKEVFLPPCPYLCQHGFCNRTDEKHLCCYSHAQDRRPHRPEERPLCPNYPRCVSTDVAHLQAYAHPSYMLPYVPCQGINTHDPAEPARFTSAEQDLWEIDFNKNEAAFHTKLCDYMSKTGFNPSASHINEVTEWFKRARPMHMCSGDVLLSMVKTYSLSSIRGLKSLWIHPDEIADAVLARGDLKEYLDLIPDKKVLKEQFLIPYIRELQASWDFSSFRPVTDEHGKLVEFQLKDFHEKYIPRVPDYVKNNTRVMRCKMYGLIGKRRMTSIEDAVKDIIKHVYTVLSSKIGIAYPTDMEVRSDFSVFSIVGPHLGDYGNAEAVLILKPEIMYHPDFYATTYAISSYNARKENWYHNGFGDNRTDWMGGTVQDKKVSMKVLFEEKYHPVAGTWAEDLAREWMCRVYYHTHNTNGLLYKKYGSSPPTMNDINVGHVKELFRLFTGRGSHTSVEGHVPNCVSLDYIEKIILTNSAYAKLYNSPVGSFFLRKLYNRNPGYMHVVADSVSLVHEEVLKVVDEPLGPNVPSGFTFAVSDKLDSTVFLPMFLPDVATVTFGVVGGSFSLILCNYPDIAKQVSGNRYLQRNKITFTFTAETKKLVVNADSSNWTTTSGSRPLCEYPKQEMSFNHSQAKPFDPNETIYWDLFVDLPKKIIFLGLVGTSTKYFQMPFCLSAVPDGFTDMRCLAFRGVGKTYSIWDLNYVSGKEETLFQY